MRIMLRLLFSDIPLVLSPHPGAGGGRAGAGRARPGPRPRPRPAPRPRLPEAARPALCGQVGVDILATYTYTGYNGHGQYGHTI